MILGLLSDTHGEARRTAAGLRLLREAGAEAFIHCGDIGGPEVLDQMAGLRAWLVWGNIDWPDTELEQHAAALGLSLSNDVPLRLELGGRRLAVFHGHEPEFSQLVNHAPGGEALRVELESCDYIVYGHTHIAADVRVDRFHLLNPGAIHRAPRATVATLDLVSGAVRFLRVPDEIA
ncbi:MAG: metallophosphoesterase family protein [Phycisphaerae bacterium]|nr:metallophosphoesterase family protein [Phycisphaerae bacterium]